MSYCNDGKPHFFESTHRVRTLNVRCGEGTGRGIKGVPEEEHRCGKCHAVRWLPLYQQTMERQAS